MTVKPITRMVVVPYWFVALVTSVTPVARLVRSLRRPKAGCCRTCGYDLRATPGRCPECGTADAAANA